MDLDDQTVRPGCNSRHRHGSHEIRPSHAMAGIDHHGQVAQGFRERYGRKVKGVPGLGLEGPDPPLTEDNVSVDTTMAYIRSPPSTPDIDGPASGHYGEEYDYTFTAIDPESDDIWYYVDWGDDSNSGWLGPYNSGEAITLSHIWNEEDTYTLRCKAKDTLGGVSEWATLEVTMPINQQSTHHIFHWFLDQFPNAFPILRHLLDV